MRHRDKYYKMTKFPDDLSQRSSFYDAVLEIDENIMKMAIANSVLFLKQELYEWFKSEGFLFKDFELSKTFKANTMNHEDIMDGDLRCLGSITINNTELLLKKAKVPEELISKIKGKIKLKSEYDFVDMTYKSTLTDDEKEKVEELVDGYIDSPIYEKFGDGFQENYYKNISKIVKSSVALSLEDSLIIKLPQRGPVSFISPNSIEYQNFKSTVDKLWLNKKLNKTLDIEKEHKPRKMKI